MSCFFKKVKPADAQIIKGFDDLRWDDQQKIRQKVDGKSATTESSKIKFLSSTNKKILIKFY